MRKKLILFPQDKGGIGKSFVATLLYDYLLDSSVRVKAFDLDHANSTFNRLVPDAEFINTDVDADKLGVLDRIVHALDEADAVVVDNRATGGGKMLAYLDETRLPDMQAELDCALVFVVIATDDKDANSQICSPSARSTTAKRVASSQAKRGVNPSKATPRLFTCVNLPVALSQTSSRTLSSPLVETIAICLPSGDHRGQQ